MAVEEKRRHLIRHELSRLANDDELAAVENAISSGKGFDAAIEEAVSIFAHLHGALEPTREVEILKLVYRNVEEIKNLPEAEVENRYLDLRTIAERAEQVRAEQLDATEFFNQPEAEADFSYWNAKKTLYAEQAVALLFGKNPKIVNSQTLSSLQRPNSPFVAKYKEILVLLERAIAERQVRPPLTIAKLTKWGDAEGFNLPPDLGKKTIQATASSDGEKTHPANLDFFYKFLIGMAIKHYQLDPGYDPDKGDTSDAFKRMVADLHSVGAKPMTEKTIRDNVKKALQRGKERGIRYKTPAKMSTSVIT